MRQTIYIDCKQTWIRRNDFFLTLGRRVTVEACLHILQKTLLHIRKLLKESCTDTVCLFLRSILLKFRIRIQKCDLDLSLEHVIKVIQAISCKMLREDLRCRIIPEVSWKNN